MSIAATLRLTSSQTISTATFTTVTNWGNPIFQDVTVWDAGSPSRITIPAGFNYALLTANVWWGPTAGGDVFARLLKNGDTGLDGTACACGLSTGFERVMLHELAPVQEGDFFEVQVWQNSGGNRSILTSSWFAIEFLQLPA